MKTPTQKMDVSRPAYIRLAQVRASMIAANGGRGVTWPEVWDHVLAVYEAATQPPTTITVTDGPGNMPVGRMLQDQADAEREFG